MIDRFRSLDAADRSLMQFELRARMYHRLLNEPVRAVHSTPCSLFFHALLDFDVQTLDFLIQRGEGYAELLRSICLVPVAALQLVHDDAPLNVFDDVEEGSIRIVLQQAGRVAAPGQMARQQVRSNAGVR